MHPNHSGENVRFNLPWIKCPQCSSLWCGPIACRFSGVKHEEVRKAAQPRPAEAYCDPEELDPCDSRGS